MRFTRAVCSAGPSSLYDHRQPGPDRCCGDRPRRFTGTDKLHRLVGMLVCSAQFFEVDSGHGSISASHSCVQGGWPGEGNTQLQPSFVSPGHWNDAGTPDDPDDDFWIEGNLRLTTDSRCIDAGDTELSNRAPTCPTSMVALRVALSACVDMGAYESGIERRRLRPEPSPCMTSLCGRTVRPVHRRTTILWDEEPILSRHMQGSRFQQRQPCRSERFCRVRRGSSRSSSAVDRQISRARLLIRRSPYVSICVEAHARRCRLVCRLAWDVAIFCGTALPTARAGRLDCPARTTLRLWTCITPAARKEGALKLHAIPYAVPAKLWPHPVAGRGSVFPWRCHPFVVASLDIVGLAVGSGPCCFA